MSADIDATLPQLIASITAVSRGSGAIAATLPQFTAAITAVPRTIATIGATLPQLDIQLLAGPRNAGTISASLPMPVADIETHARVAITFNAVLLANMGVYNYGDEGTGGAGVTGRGAYVYDDPSINVGSGGLKVGGEAGTHFPINEITIGSGGGEIGGAADEFGYSLNPELAVTLPAIQMAFAGLDDSALAVTFPALDIEMSGITGTIGDMDVVFRPILISMTGGAAELALTLPAIEVGMTGFAATLGDMAVTLPKMRVDLTGNPAIVGNLDLTLPPIAIDMEGQVGTIGDMAVTLRALSVRLTGNPGALGNMAMSFAPIEMAFAGYSQITGSMAVSFAPMRMDFLGTLRAQLQLMLVANTVSGAVSTYEGLNTNSMCFFNNKYLFADATGVHVVDADNDNDVNIDASFQSGLLDLGSNVQKRVSNVYAGLRADGNMLVRVGTEEMPATEYVLSQENVATIKQRRVATGKGLKGKYWQFEVANSDGCDFDFDSIDMLVTDTSRRI